MLIGFAGQIEVGKSTSSGVIMRENGYIRKSFSEPLKLSASIMTGLPAKVFYDTRMKGEYQECIGMTPRKFLQLLGTEFARKMIYEDFWIMRMRNALIQPECDIRSGYNIVIDDVRFQNEADLIHELGGKVILIRRGEDIAPTHDSEEIDVKVDRIIYNNGTLALLGAQIRRYMEDLS